LDNVIANVVLDIQRQTIATPKGKASIIYKLGKEDIGSNNNNNKDIVFVEADKERITQVLYNLLDNAVKFIKDSGIVSVTVEKKDQEGANKEKRRQQEVIVKVEDTGIGIHPEILPRLFTKFATKSVTGTGLGLYISKNFIEAHGGKIWAKNNSNGNGATFAFSLPLTK
jgi:two-component system sensor histidine kinase VicK